MEKLETGRTFEDIIVLAREIQGLRRDHYVYDVPTRIVMADDGTIDFKIRDFDGEETINRPMTSWALNQLSTKLGIPNGYAEKCIQAAHADLAAQNINTWLTEQKPGKRRKSVDYFLREYDGSIDAVLTPNYTAFDSPQILKTVEQSVNLSEYKVTDSFVSHERLHVRMVRKNKLNVPDEELFPGIAIDSSDVGRNAFNISYVIYDSSHRCAFFPKIGGKLYHQRHMGITVSEVHKDFTNNMKAIPALDTKAEEVIKNAKTTFVDLKDEKVFRKMVSEIRRLAVVSPADAESMVKLAEAQGDFTLWGIGNAMIQKAESFPLDKRISIENAAGGIMA